MFKVKNSLPSHSASCVRRPPHCELPITIAKLAWDKRWLLMVCNHDLWSFATRRAFFFFFFFFGRLPLAELPLRALTHESEKMGISYIKRGSTSLITALGCGAWVGVGACVNIHQALCCWFQDNWFKGHLKKDSLRENISWWNSSCGHLCLQKVLLPLWWQHSTERLQHWHNDNMSRGLDKTQSTVTFMPSQ